ncbi:glycosyltransferase family 61 protein [Rhizobium sp. TRM95796]|uniref:glycosyltransferase family 61 protein n=1 Tax=Rhizobium sp. TRM95796 TaxID=2979862 RepID=UPI0021E7127E|nr:glycosyltransferase family 61 protein [Rhizobium sp. TRM95796]MCV3769090.1 glycosyltransferase family 61 protein [Rhizobium sp. TRM95796]
MEIFPQRELAVSIDFLEPAGLRPDGVAAAQRVRFPPVRLVSMTGCDYGGLGLFRRDGAYHVAPDIFPDYIEPLARRSLENGQSSVWFGGMLNDASAVVELDRPAIVALHPNWIFGHFLLEMLPKLILLDRIADPAIPLLVAANGPGWMKTILGEVSRRPLFEYDHKTSVVRAPECLALTNLAIGGWLRPEMRTAFELLRAGLLLQTGVGRQGDWLYISRRKTTSGWHKIANEEEIEIALAEMGFAIIHPQEYSFAQQVRLFHQARLVVGEYSSAMHNAVFCQPGACILCLNRINRYQEQIASAFDHRIGFVKPKDGAFRDWSTQASGVQALEFDPRHVRDAVEAIMRQGCPPPP